LTKKLKKIEFGTSTGRQRMVGWWDSVEKADVLRFGGYQDVVINKLDVLSYHFPKGGNLKVCVAYRDPKGNIIKHVPRNDKARAKLEPVYEELPGWEEDISKVRSFEELPINAKRYVALCIRSVVELAQSKGYKGALPNVRYIGVGPEPSQIIKDAPETKDLIKIS
jgi:adenylosuccinate synthase